jgi:hypothetical protein
VEKTVSHKANLIPFEKGDGRAGRKPGSPNKATRVMKQAVINAAAKSIHCPPDDKSLEGYCTYLADAHPPVFAGLMGRLIPVQAKVKTDGNMRIENLNINMSLSDMVSKFELKLKSGYRPAPPALVIDNDETGDGDGENES